MRLHHSEISGFKSIEKANVTFGPLNFLIGANGSGKSNLLQLFELLRAVARGHLQVFVAKAGGASTLLRHGAKATRQIRIYLHFESFSYALLLEHGQGDILFLAGEHWYHRSAQDESKLIVEGRGNFDSPEGGHRESQLQERAGDPEGIAHQLLETLRSFRVHHFQDTTPTARVKQKGPIDDNAFLRGDASNLAAFLHRLQVTADSSYRRLIAAVRQVAPYFEDFRLRLDPLSPGMIQLEWTEIGSEAYFNAHSLSDGTLRFICLAALLLQPAPPPLLLIDEPELGMHPHAIQLLAAMLRSASKRTQVLVASQSVTLMNQLSDEELIVVDRKAGASTFRRLEKAELAGWKDGYSLGELWEKNVLGGTS